MLEHYDGTSPFRRIEHDSAAEERWRSRFPAASPASGPASRATLDAFEGIASPLFSPMVGRDVDDAAGFSEQEARAIGGASLEEILEAEAAAAAAAVTPAGEDESFEALEARAALSGEGAAADEGAAYDYYDGDEAAFAGLELQPEVAMLYLQQLLALGLVRVPLSMCDALAYGGGGGGGGGDVAGVHGEALQVSLESFLALESEMADQEGGAHTDERVQIVHKLLLDTLNLALRVEAAEYYRLRAPRVATAAAPPHGGASRVAPQPAGVWHALPSDEVTLQRLVDNAVQQALTWLVQSTGMPEGTPIEVQLSCLLQLDTDEIEGEWRAASQHQEALIAEASSALLDGLVDECAELVGSISARRGAADAGAVSAA